jgi:pyruvate-ferredoxin/flavodoxin oxidoreductase
MGADKQQTLKAVKEAESYPGPSIVLAYVPCINHGSSKGMAKSQDEGKRAVEAGYWPLYRFDPRRAAEGKPALQVDYKAPNRHMREFLAGEVRYAALSGFAPEEAKRLGGELEEHCIKRYEELLYLAGNK